MLKSFQREQRGGSSPESTVTASLQGRGLCSFFFSLGFFCLYDISCHLSYKEDPFTCHNFQDGAPYFKVSGLIPGGSQRLRCSEACQLTHIETVLCNLLHINSSFIPLYFSDYGLHIFCLITVGVHVYYNVYAVQLWSKLTGKFMLLYNSYYLINNLCVKCKKIYSHNMTYQYFICLCIILLLKNAFKFYKVYVFVRVNFISELKSIYDYIYNYI